MAKKLHFRAAEIYRETLFISTPFIKLDSALKLSGAAATGGEAKLLVESRQARVNGEECTARGRKLYPGDRINFRNSVYVIAAKDEDK